MHLEPDSIFKSVRQTQGNTNVIVAVLGFMTSVYRKFQVGEQINLHSKRYHRGTDP